LVALFTACMGGGAILGASPLSAQVAESDSDAGDRSSSASVRDVPSVLAARRIDAIHVDGRADESAWQVAPTATSFVQGDPDEGAPPAQPSEVRVLFDDDALYVFARLYEPDSDQIADQLVRRDEEGQYDYFELSLDPNHDHLTGYRFRVSAANQQSDSYLYGDTREDDNWDAVWSSGTSRDSLGWSVEMRIPLSQIRYEAGTGAQTWGVNFTRRRLASNSTSYFSLQSRTVRGRVSQFGALNGIEVSGGTHRLEVLPYFASEFHRAEADPGDPLSDGTELTHRLGLDVRAGLGTAFSLDATVNPDFGQVEVDPEVINLTAFETFFPEKRPFFVQDAQVFGFQLGSRSGGGGGGGGFRGGDQLFFSRRIGRTPHGRGPDEADFTDIPGQTTILGAAKLTGRTESGLSVGFLTAATAAEKADVYFQDDDLFDKSLVEPASQFGVARLQQDFRNGGTTVGAIATGMRRDLPSDGEFDDLASNAYSAGLDFEHQWGGAQSRNWRLFGFFAGTHVRGSTEALLDIQQSSNHYFQRPDADYLQVDSTATSMTGFNWRLQFSRQSAEHWTWSVWLAQITPGFEVNDLGFSRSSERLDGGASLSYRNIRPGSLFRSYSVRLTTFHNWRQDLLDDFFDAGHWARTYKRGTFSLSSNFDFLNNWGLNLRTSWNPQGLSDTKTRGGPLMTEPGSVSFNVSMNTDRRKVVSLRPSVEYRPRFRGNGYEVSTGLSVSLRPSSNWEIELQPRFSRERNGSQYVTDSDAAFFEPTYGDRYLFGDLLRHSFSMETRINVAFSPKLSLQLFAQPLVSTGEYLAYRQLEASETFDFIEFEEGVATETEGGVLCGSGSTCVLDGERYVDVTGDGLADDSFGDQDFNIRSLRGSAVLRWEYRPGSVLFLVWQQARREELDNGDFRLGRDLGGIFSAPGEDTFVAKASFYVDF
jgi:hypothetical protein